MSNEGPANERKENSTQKRRYVSPVLVRYGQVRALTQGGSGPYPELFNCANFASKQLKCNRSDQRSKENIIHIGDHPLGIGLYLFDYKPEFRDQWGHGRQFGVMAQEVELVMPEAVCVDPDGYKAVDYGMLGISRAGHSIQSNHINHKQNSLDPRLKRTVIVSKLQTRNSKVG